MEYEVWGEIEEPEHSDIDISALQDEPPTAEGYESLREFIKELSAISNPYEHGKIGRAVEDGYANRVAVYHHGGRQEIYEISEDLEYVDITLQGEENHQHAVKTFRTDFDELESWMQEIILLQDGLEWEEWD